ncbi:MAG: hypothetical protein RL762_1101 [Bacteroidota bacterium]|jgi:hypothetical protein
MKEGCPLASNTTLFNKLLIRTQSEKIILSKTNKAPSLGLFLWAKGLKYRTC